jgi:hypothetical protein
MVAVAVAVAMFVSASASLVAFGPCDSSQVIVEEKLLSGREEATSSKVTFEQTSGFLAAVSYVSFVGEGSGMLREAVMAPEYWNSVRAAYFGSWWVEEAEDGLFEQTPFEQKVVAQMLDNTNWQKGEPFVASVSQLPLAVVGASRPVMSCTAGRMLGEEDEGEREP